MQIEVDHVMAMNEWMDSQMVDSLCIWSHTLIASELQTPMIQK